MGKMLIMAKEKKLCKRCLLSDMGGQVYEERIARLLVLMDKEIKAEEELYKERLSICRGCEKLSGEDAAFGTCLACGCYVELRAAVKKNRCPYRFW